MNIKNFYSKFFKKHPLGALYGTLLGIAAFSAAVPMFKSGQYEAALTDLAMTVLLITLMLKNFISYSRRQSSAAEKCASWAMLFAANILALLPSHNFPGSLSTAFAFSLLICAFVLYFSGTDMALHSIIPTLWCCVFMPYHEEFMLLLSFPLRLSAAALSAATLILSGTKVILSGTSLTLPGLNIAITDACSGINQLDAFILIAFAAVELLHKKLLWKALHFSFIIPSIIIGNSLRIVITVLLYKAFGEVILEKTWHTALGYVQIILALLIFVAVGKIFSVSDNNTKDEKK